MPRQRTVKRKLLPAAINLAFLRNKKGLSQGALADKLGTGLSNIARIETGAYAPSVELVMDAVKYFKVNADVFLRGKMDDDETELQQMFTDIRGLTDKQRETIRQFLIAFGNGQQVRFLTTPVEGPGISDK